MHRRKDGIIFQFRMVDVALLVLLSDQGIPIEFTRQTALLWIALLANVLCNDQFPISLMAICNLQFEPERRCYING